MRAMTEVGGGPRGPLHATVVRFAAAYITWVLLGTVAFVSHLGEQAPSAAAFLPAYGRPGGRANSSAAGLLSFLGLNAPAALAFVLPHSLLRPQRLALWLARAKLASHGRLVYNVIAAASLHALLASFVPLRTPVVIQLPLAPDLHVLLSAGCLAFAATCFVTDPRTASLLGLPQALGRSAPRPPPGMDAITWMADCVIRRGGPLAFVLFTGVSILPPELTLGDAVTRAVAALYLRLRSAPFRSWLQEAGTSHHLIWAVRGSFLAFVLLRAEGTGAWQLITQWRVLAALVLSLGLWIAEHLGEGKHAGHMVSLTDGLNRIVFFWRASALAA